jgi:TatD DNase family protein
MLIDTHAHLWWDSYKDDLGQVVARAKAAGVEQIIVPGTNVASSQQAISIAKQYSHVLYPAIGIHPEDAVGADMAALRQLLADNQDVVVAIGEIGTDLYSDEVKQTIAAQKVLFRAQLELALEFDLPVIIHTRDSFTETWEVLSSLPQIPRGQFHCFSVDETALHTVLSAGFHVSFCGNIAWSKRVAKLVQNVPDDRLLLETDSPFMKPKERNEPATVSELAELIAQLRGTTAGEIAELTTSNAKRLYRL